MAHAIDAAEGAARAALDKEFARLRASLAKVKVQEAAGEVRVASIPWDVWQQMKREQAARVQPTVN
jgi:flagellar hook-length control protein FliK